MMMRRAPKKGRKAAVRMRAPKAAAPKASKKPQLDDFLASKDYTGAVALLDFQRRAGDVEERTLPWLGYAAFHLGDYAKALEAYDEWLKEGGPAEVNLYRAACLYYLGEYDQAKAAALAGPTSPLQIRVLFHASHKQGDENELMQYHGQLTNSQEDQLSLAAIHYLRSHFQELDYYDVSLEILSVYLQTHPESAIAINLKACNHFRLYNGKAAEAEFKALIDQGQNIDDVDLIQHNLVVFRNGENALRVLPGIVDYIPEAKLNLVIYYLRNDDVTEAHELVSDLEPSTPQEYILKGVVHAMLGQQTGSRDDLKRAQQYFQLVGASASECDTIPGRQCMASCFFLLKQFEDVNIYLSSVKAYMYNDDDFNYNYGISLGAVGNFKEAEESLLLVANEKVHDYCYISWLARCYIMNKKARMAWDLYLKMDTNNESFNLLQLIANDCYKMGEFYFAAKAFDVLERLDPDPEYWEGKRGACMGVFQKVIAGQESTDSLRDVIVMLRNTSNPQVEYIVRTVQKWCKMSGLNIV